MNIDEEILINCKVCTDNYPLRDIITLSCSHKFCQHCLKKEWEFKIKTEKKSQESDLKCPEENCNKPVHLQILKGLNL